jgi:predicted ATP-dependent protease
VEGFYRVCKAVGLSGTQGVLVPRANLRNLMLDPETTEAIASGRFHIYPVAHIDEGIELLTGVRAGATDEAGTLNHLVAQRLAAMAEKLRRRPVAETRVVHEPAPEGAPPKPPSPPGPPR